MTDAPSPDGSTSADAVDEACATAVEAPGLRTAAPNVRWSRLANPFALGFALTLGALVALLLGIAVSNLSTVLIYIAFALFAALGLDPVIRFLERRGVARGWAITMVSLALCMLLAAVLWLVVPTLVAQVESFVSDFPAAIDDFRQSGVFHFLEGVFGTGLSGLVSDVQDFFADPAHIAALGGGALKVGAGIFSGVSGALIVVVLTLYFVASLDMMKQSFYRLVPARNRPGVARLTDQITDSVGAYLMGMVILAFFNSIVAFLLHLLLGLPFPALMGVLAFLITLIPLVGPVLYWGSATVIALFTNPIAALSFALAYLVYIQVEAYVLTPRVMSRAISIPGALVVIGALVGGTLLGLLGALVAIPVTASILLIVKQVAIPRQDAKE